jgi:hypothetical protein
MKRDTRSKSREGGTAMPGTSLARILGPETRVNRGAR